MLAENRKFKSQRKVIIESTIYSDINTVRELKTKFIHLQKTILGFFNIRPFPQLYN